MMNAMQLRAAARRKAPINTSFNRPAPVPPPAPVKPKAQPVPLPPGPEIKEPEVVDTIVVEAAPDAKIVVEMGGDGTNLVDEKPPTGKPVKPPKHPKN